MIGQLSHIVLSLIFAGTVFLIIFFKNYKIITRNVKIILILVGITFVYSLFSDNIGVLMNLWGYGDGMYSGIRVPFMALDDLVFIILIQLVITSATLIMLEKNRKR